MSFSGRSVLAQRHALSYMVTSNMKPNETLPNGPPRSFGWPVGPRVSNGMSPATNRYLRDWAIFFRASGQSPSSDTMIRTEDYQLWGYSNAASGWTSISNVFRPGGQTVLEADLTSAATIVTHSNSPNPLIATMEASRATHTYPTSLKPGPIDLSDIKALVACSTAKLISASGADVRGDVGKIVCAEGIDWWPDNSTGTPNTECLHGPFAIVREYPQRFYGTTMRLPELRLYGLPTGIEQLTDTSYTPGVDPDYVP